MKSHGRVRGAVRIARQPSKLKVMGSNPIGPANKLYRGLVLRKDYSHLYIETTFSSEEDRSAVFCIDWLLGGKYALVKKS